MNLLETRDDRLPLGTWLKIPAPDPVEIAAAVGFDFVVIDLEHTMLNTETAYTLIALATARDLHTIVRVPDHQPSTIQRVLDAGASGVLVPHVDTVEQAASVSRATRFPPYGTRGSGGTSRAGGWGRLPRQDYLAFGNHQALCLPQLESEEALRAAPDILALDGVTGVLVGAADLALEMGVSPSDPRLSTLIEEVLEAAAAAEKPCGFALGSDPARAGELAAQGFGFLVMGNDTSYLAGAMGATVREARRTTSKSPEPGRP